MKGFYEKEKPLVFQTMRKNSKTKNSPRRSIVIQYPLLSVLVESSKWSRIQGGKAIRFNLAGKVGVQNMMLKSIGSFQSFLKKILISKHTTIQTQKSNSR